MDVFPALRWPGNVRELRNCLERMVLLATDPILGLDLLPTAILEDGRRAVYPRLDDPRRRATDVLAAIRRGAAISAAPPLDRWYRRTTLYRHPSLRYRLKSLSGVFDFAGAITWYGRRSHFPDQALPRGGSSLSETWLYGAVRGLLQTANARTGNQDRFCFYWRGPPRPDKSPEDLSRTLAALSSIVAMCVAKCSCNKRIATPWLSGFWSTLDFASRFSRRQRYLPVHLDA